MRRLHKFKLPARFLIVIPSVETFISFTGFFLTCNYLLFVLCMHHRLLESFRSFIFFKYDAALCADSCILIVLVFYILLVKDFVLVYLQFCCAFSSSLQFEPSSCLSEFLLLESGTFSCLGILFLLNLIFGRHFPLR